MSQKPAHKLSKKFAAYPQLNPFGIGKNISAADLIDQSMLAYNGGRLREAAQLPARKMLPDDGYSGGHTREQAEFPETQSSSVIPGDEVHRKSSGLNTVMLGIESNC